MASLTVSMPNVSICMTLQKPSQAHKHWQDSWEHFLGVQDVKTLWVWRACVVETIFVGLLIFGSIIISTGTRSRFSNPLVFIAFFHFVEFGILLRGAIPPAAGHFNPAVTLAAVLAGLYSPLRGLMHMTAQCLGAVLGALCAKTLLPEEEVEKYLLAGCRYRNSLSGVPGLNRNQAFLSEFIFSFMVLYIVFMVVLDRKQFQLIGLERVPLYVGMTLGCNIYVSGIIAPGYNGAYMNPARCTGPAIAYGGRELWSCLWIYWCTPALAAIVVAALYRTIPPDHRERMPITPAEQQLCSKQISKALTENGSVRVARIEEHQQAADSYVIGEDPLQSSMTSVNSYHASKPEV
ncbi:hypothetical protein R1flu_006714 [Riccia fluitans]|uniref:Uncharacterized protein n=1 Tax=Riccia fluitans TaxID=41844 RepID=A0ABD1YX49_9MARC